MDKINDDRQYSMRQIPLYHIIPDARRSHSGLPVIRAIRYTGIRLLMKLTRQNS